MGTLREAMRLAVSARAHGRQVLFNPAAFERAFHGRLSEIPRDTLRLAQALAETSFTSVEELEQA
jgi:hypothetical protein